MAAIPSREDRAEFTQAERVRIAEIGAALRSVPKKASKARAAAALNQLQLTKEDHELMVRWVHQRLLEGLRRRC